MSSRRFFLRHCAVGSGALALGGLLSACGGGGEDGATASNNAGGGAVTPPANTGGGNVTPPANNGGGSVTPNAAAWLMPDEAGKHKATWMAYGASAAIWGAQLPAVQQALARIANAIVNYEPVNMLVRQGDLSVAKQNLDPRVNLIVAALDDLWMRDTGPIFVKNAKGEKAGVKFNFNGWGSKQVCSNDKNVADVVTGQASVPMLSTKLVLEGGGIEVDGKGTAIITESCVLNANRNPGLNKSDCEAELKRLLGIRKVIWLPGIANKDITDGHTDFYARFVRPGVVAAHLDTDPSSYDNVVTKRHLEILQAATDADNVPLQVVVVEAPRNIRPGNDQNTFAAGYINFYVTQSAVFVPEFGDAAADAKAKSQYEQLYPGRTVVQINIDPIAAGGGGIHCTTQQEPV